MANPAYPFGAFFKHAHRVPHEDVSDATKLKRAYRDVEEREGNRCQVTGVTLVPKTENFNRLREHHHIRGRNVRPEWVHDPVRIVLCSKFIHDLFTAKKLLIDGDDARVRPLPLRWNRRLVKPGKEPIELGLEDELRTATKTTGNGSVGPSEHAPLRGGRGRGRKE